MNLVDRCVDKGTHDAIKADPAKWAALPFVGEMLGLELRNCECGSTLAIEKVQP